MPDSTLEPRVHPKDIDDVEIVISKSLVHTNIVGTKKFNRDLMIALYFNHSTDILHDGEAHVFLTQKQVVDLINQLNAGLLKLIKDKT